MAFIEDGMPTVLMSGKCTSSRFGLENWILGRLSIRRCGFMVYRLEYCLENCLEYKCIMIPIQFNLNTSGVLRHRV